MKKLIWENILLVGDAAALCSPLHGAGTDTACISGRIAAEMIALNQVPRYPARLWSVMGKKLTMEKRLCKLWHIFGYRLVLAILNLPGLGLTWLVYSVGVIDIHEINA